MNKVFGENLIKIFSLFLFLLLLLLLLLLLFRVREAKGHLDSKGLFYYNNTADVNFYLQSNAPVTIKERVLQLTICAPRHK